MNGLPDSHKDLLERPIYAVLTTILPSGQPHSTVVWVDEADGYLRFNTTLGRQKYKNLQRDPRVTIVLLDPNDGYHWVEIRGTAELVEGENVGRDHIESLSWRYMGQKYYGGYNTWSQPEDETRLTYRVITSKISPY